MKKIQNTLNHASTFAPLQLFPLIDFIIDAALGAIVAGLLLQYYLNH